jgi:hypothetical protein
MNKSHPLYSKKESEITDNDLELLTDEQYQEYIMWSVKKNLDYMVSEGFVESFVCPDTGEVLYRTINNQE